MSTQEAQTLTLKGLSRRLEALETENAGLRQKVAMIKHVFSKVTWIARGAAALMGLAAMVMVMVSLAATAAWAETLTVNTTADTNDGTCNPPPFNCTLREAVQISGTNGVPDSINFASNVRGTITLGGPLTIASDSSNRVTINGPGANALAVSGNDASRVFAIQGGADAAINRLTIANGNGQTSGGGGINNEGELVLNDSVVRDSRLSTFIDPDNTGGGIRNTGVLTLNRSTVSGNFAGLSGGINNEATGSLGIYQSSILNNDAAFGGGGILNRGNLTLDRSTVSGNTTGTSGGGIESHTGSGRSATISNSTISGNTAADDADFGSGASGGGIEASGRTRIVYSTITGNDVIHSAHPGAGVASEGSTGTVTYVKATIISDNADDGDVGLDGGSFNSFTSAGYNLIGLGNAVSAFSETGDQTDITIPYLAPLADNGGPTQTHAILPNSRAIDSADPSSTLATDQRGVARPQNGDSFGSPRGDIGAYEKEPPPPNDDFARSLAINTTSGSVNGRTIEATREEGEPDHASSASSLGENSVWYRWTAPAPGPVSFDTCTSSFDSILAVYTGSSLGSLNQVASDDDSCTTPNGLGSRLSFNASAGTTYRIAVSRFSANGQGTFTLRFPADTTSPRVRSTTPASNATNIASNSNVFANFSEPMRTDSINSSTVTIRKAGTTQSLPATVSYSTSIWRAVLNPSANLQPGASYLVTVTVGARDLAGNALDQEPNTQGNQAKIWTFRVRP